MTKNFTPEFENDDLYEHHRVIATDGQVPLRVDKFLMNFMWEINTISIICRTKLHC